jgi:DHA2 family multidrug resistance protein
MVGDVGEKIVLKPRKKDLMKAEPIVAAAPAFEVQKPRVRTPIDAWGLTLLVVGIGCLQYVLERGQADDWFDSNSIRICTLLAVVAIPTFIWWELKISHPIINLRLFKHPAVRNGTVMMMMLGLMLYSTVFVLPIFMNTIMNYSATQTGMIFIPGAILTAFMMPLAGKLMKKTDPRLLIFFGMITVEVFLFLLTKFNPGTTDRQIFYALMVRGLGLAFLFVPINAVVLGQFVGAELGQVAGLLNLLRQIGGSIGIATLSTLLQTYNAKNYTSLISHMSLLNPITYSQLKGAQNAMAQKFQGALGDATFQSAGFKLTAYRLQKQIFCLSFNQIVWILLFCFGLAIVPLIFVKPPKNLDANIDVH